MPKNPEMDELERWLAERRKLWEESIDTASPELRNVLDTQTGVIEMIQDYMNAIRVASSPAKSTAFGSSKMDQLLTERSRCIESLLRSLYGLPRPSQFMILTSYLSLDQLLDLEKFQREHQQQ